MAAITAPAISVEDYIAHYLESSEKPAYEYVDGLLIRKAMPSLQHSRIQRNLIVYLTVHYGHKYEALPELTSRLSTNRFLVPDIAVAVVDRRITGSYPGPTDPVFLCVEIKSPSDRVPTLWAKCVDYHAWGVPFCWVIDPERKLAWEYTPADEEPRRASDFLTAGEIRISLTSVFKGLNSDPLR